MIQMPISVLETYFAFCVFVFNNVVLTETSVWPLEFINTNWCNQTVLFFYRLNTLMYPGLRSSALTEATGKIDWPTVTYWTR